MASDPWEAHRWLPFDGAGGGAPAGVEVGLVMGKKRPFTDGARAVLSRPAPRLQAGRASGPAAWRGSLRAQRFFTSTRSFAAGVSLGVGPAGAGSLRAQAQVARLRA